MPLSKVAVRLSQVSHNVCYKLARNANIVCITKYNFMTAWNVIIKPNMHAVCKRTSLEIPIERFLRFGTKNVYTCCTIKFLTV